MDELDALIRRIDAQVQMNKTVLLSVDTMEATRRYKALTYEVEHGVEIL